MTRALQCAGRVQAFMDLLTRPVTLRPERPAPIATPREVVSIGSLRELHERDLDSIGAVLSAATLPDGNGIDVLAYVHGMRGDLPVIIVGDRDEAQLLIEAVRAGAVDFLVRSRDYLSLLPLCVEKSLEHHRIRSENERLRGELGQRNLQLQMAISQLESLVRTDELTGLANRRCLGDALEREWAVASRTGRALSCMMIDLDGFKGVNDACGHHRGDDVLRLTARIIEANVRGIDIPARVGGDEFFVLLPSTAAPGARDVAERIKSEFERTMSLTEDVAGRLGLSIGVADNIVGRPATPEEMIRLADNALYIAKAGGKCRVVVAEAA